MTDDKLVDNMSQKLCDWCDKPIPLSNYSINNVCSRCYTLLSRAGLSDEKIHEKVIFQNGLLANT
jgi:hypothetical protein